jgi:uncharacterized damage-inducible protein DinB
VSTPVLLRQLRHDVWATEQLVAHCRGLDPAELERTLPGTYGTVRATLAHIVSADEGYLTRLLGAILHDPPFRNDHDVSLDELAAHLPHIREGIERLFAQGEVDGDRTITDTPIRRPDQPRIEMEAWVPLTQFVHHGNDHRSQIATILSANGVAGPDLQVWPQAQALGATRPGA